MVRQHSAAAAYWHDFARKLPPPPTPEELAEAREARQRAEREARAKAEHDRLLREWDGSLPDERILALRPGFLRQFAKQERGLAGAVVAASADAQRAPARRVARRTFERAGLDNVGWIADGLRALAAGRALPPPFDDRTAAWDRLLTDPAVPHTLVRTPDGRHDNALQQAMAFPAIFGAAEEDPLEALGRTLSAAAVTFGDERAAFFAEARKALADGRITSRTDPP